MWEKEGVVPVHGHRAASRGRGAGVPGVATLSEFRGCTDLGGTELGTCSVTKFRAIVRAYLYIYIYARPLWTIPELVDEC